MPRGRPRRSAPEPVVGGGPGADGASVVGGVVEGVPLDGESEVRSVLLADFEGKPDASARQILEWVFNNIDVAGLKPKDAPTSGAWSLLMRVRSVPDLAVDFYKQVWPKLLPTKAQLEVEERLKGGGTDELERSLDRVEAALGSAGPPAEYQF